MPVKEFVVCRGFPLPFFLFFAFREACFISYTKEGSCSWYYGVYGRKDKIFLKKDLDSAQAELYLVALHFLPRFLFAHNDAFLKRYLTRANHNIFSSNEAYLRQCGGLNWA